MPRSGRAWATKLENEWRCDEFTDESNVQNHRSASRGKTQQARGSAAHREESSFSNIKSALRRANERSFVEDYNLEHTVLHTSIIQETSSAGSDFVDTQYQERPVHVRTTGILPIASTRIMTTQTRQLPVLYPTRTYS